MRTRRSIKATSDATSGTVRRLTTMRTFELRFSGDMLNEQGEPANGYFGAGHLQTAPFVQLRVPAEQAPHDPSYWDRLYSMQMEPQHIAAADGLVIIRPYVRRSNLRPGCGKPGRDRTGGRGHRQDRHAGLHARTTSPSSTPPSRSPIRPRRRPWCSILALAKKLPAQQRMADRDVGRTSPRLSATISSVKRSASSGWGGLRKELVRLLTPFQMRILISSRHCASARGSGARRRARARSGHAAARVGLREPALRLNERSSRA